MADTVWQGWRHLFWAGLAILEKAKMGKKNFEGFPQKGGPSICPYSNVMRKQWEGYNDADVNRSQKLAYPD